MMRTAEQNRSTRAKRCPTVPVPGGCKVEEGGEEGEEEEAAKEGKDGLEEKQQNGRWYLI